MTKKRGKQMELINIIITMIRNITGLITRLYQYRTLYTITGLLATRHFHTAKKKHKYAILVAARNEETVIGNLLDSIKQQDYDKDLVTVFVVADNCTDNTAQIVRQNGDVCYERTDTKNLTKGYALQYLVECIRKDYGIAHFKGYFIFDADNLLKSDYITRMNESFDAGQKIITSYRNTKNFNDNWISASYAVHWLRTIRTEHRARSFFHLATRIQGTGFLFASEIIQNGWNYTGLTEDRAFCADAVANGYEISYNHDAIFYDEQPISIKVAMRQRIRWAKGHLQALKETGGKLLWHIFHVPQSVTRKKGLLTNIKLRFISFDMLTIVFPYSLLTFLRKWILFFLRIILMIGAGKIYSTEICPKMVQRIFSLFRIQPTTATDNLLHAIILLFLLTLSGTIYTYLKSILIAAYIYIAEHKRIPKIKWYRKLWFCLTFPIFDVIGRMLCLQKWSGNQSPIRLM